MESAHWSATKMDTCASTKATTSNVPATKSATAKPSAVESSTTESASAATGFQSRTHRREQDEAG
jgi:hypothetical protein